MSYLTAILQPVVIGVVIIKSTTQATSPVPVVAVAQVYCGNMFSIKCNLESKWCG